MKQLITLAMLLGAFTFYAQEVDRQKVVLEVGTGTWCPSCPAVVDIIHALEAEGAQIAVVKYHINDIYENTASDTRKTFYNFPWYPTTYYDADHVGYDDWATYSVHEAMYLDRMATTTPFTASLAVDGVSETSISGSVTIDKVADYTGADLRVHIVLTESHIPDNWHGEVEVNNAERAMNNDGQGEAIDFSSGDSQQLAFNFDFETDWIKENCQIIFFIQDHTTKEVLQGDFVDVETFLGVSSFNTTNVGVIVPNPAVNQISLKVDDFSTISQVAICDISGKQVYQASDYASAISVAGLQQGFYILNYMENDLKKTAKFIKR